MIHVTLTTEEGEVLDSFSVQYTAPKLREEVGAIELLANQVRDVLEYRFEVEDL